MDATGELEAEARIRQTFPGLVKVDAWSQHPWLIAGFSTRLGGESSAYGIDDLNLGWTQSDDPVIVSRNRSRFLTAAGVLDKSQLLTLRQFHSNVIHHICVSAAPFGQVEGAVAARGDGFITDVAGITLGVQTADCVPVLVADLRQRVVGAFHAGWRGTLGRIVQHGAGDFLARFRSRREDLVAAIGPCIGACCFEVGDEVRRAFESQFEYGRELFPKAESSSVMQDTRPIQLRDGSAEKRAGDDPRLHLDLVEANRRQLLEAGLADSAISAIAECTACARTPDGSRRYFSHRAEQGFTGRMLSVIGICSAQDAL